MKTKTQYTYKNVVQHDAGQKAFEKAQDQIKSIQQNLVAKEKDLQNIDAGIQKNQSLASEGHCDEEETHT